MYVRLATCSEDDRRQSSSAVVSARGFRVRNFLQFVICSSLGDIWKLQLIYRRGGFCPSSPVFLLQVIYWLN